MVTAIHQPIPQPIPQGVAERPARSRRTSSSRFCAFGIGDAELRDLAFGSLSPILVAFVEDGDPAWQGVARLLEAVASDRLRCLLADPLRCRTAAPLLGHAGTIELLLIDHGCLTRRIDVSTPPAGVVALVSGGPPTTP